MQNQHTSKMLISVVCWSSFIVCHIFGKILQSKLVPELLLHILQINTVGLKSGFSEFPACYIFHIVLDIKLIGMTEQVIFNGDMNDKMFKIVNWTEKVKHFEVSKLHL